MAKKTVISTGPASAVQANTPTLSLRQKAEQILKKHTIKSSEGQDMFTNEAEIYREMSLSPEEADAFLGGRNPFDYFKEGLVHSSLKGFFGDLLGEEREEVMALKKVIKSADIPMFKHRRFNQYLLLIPKSISENEVDANGEFISKVVHQDYRVVAFTGQGGVPSAYEETFFMNECKKILTKLQQIAKERGLEAF